MNARLDPEPDGHPSPTRWSAERLRRAAPLLRLDRVRAGDVLLTRGRGLDSRLIARMSNGRWSHAALWVPGEIDGRILGLTGWSSLQLIEADDFGTGPTRLDVLSVKLHRAIVPLARLPGHPEDAVLLRHPGVGGIGEGAFLRALEAMNGRSMFRSYPPLDRLVDAASLSPMAKLAVRRSLGAVYRRAADAPRPGPFCSELVAQTYALLGLPLFEGVAPEPGTVSPNRLHGGGSLLRPVDGAILTADDIDLDATGTAGDAMPSFERAAYVPRLVAQNERTEIIERQYEAFREEMRLGRAADLRAARAVNARGDALIWTLIADPPPFFSSGGRRVARECFMSAAFARAIDTLVEPVENAAAAARDVELMQASLVLREFEIDLRRSATHDLVRTNLLATLRLSRKVPKGLSRRRRRRFIDDWRDSVRERGETTAFLERLMRPGEEAQAIRSRPSCQALVRAVLDDAAEIAMRDIRAALSPSGVEADSEGSDPPP